MNRWFHTVKIISEGSGPSSDKNSHIYLDGKKLEGVSEISYYLKAGNGLGRIIIEMAANVELDVLTKLVVDKEYENLALITDEELADEIEIKEKNK